MAHEESTRTFDTVQGCVNYAELNDLIAEPYRLTLDSILNGDYDTAPVDVDLLRGLHHRFVHRVMPGIAGVWRKEPVQVGSHIAPSPHLRGHGDAGCNGESRRSDGVCR